MVAAFFGHINNLKQLLRDADKLDPASSMRALYWAARRGQSVCVDVLLRHQDENPWNEASKTQIPLLAAAQFGHLECARLLLGSSHIDINARDNSGASALSLAVANSHSDIVALLLADQSIDVNIRDRGFNTPLHMAVDVAENSILSQLLSDKRTDVECLDKHGRSILSWAAEYGSIESTSLVLQTRRISVNQKDLAGRTPLLYAAQHGHLPVIKMLINVGHDDPLGQDSLGRNAHSWAAPLRNANVLRYLTRKYPAGADVPDHNGWTPAAWTLDHPTRPENLIILLRHGKIDVNRRDGTNGRSLLSWIASYGVDSKAQVRMVEALVHHDGTDLEARDAGGRTPLSEAAGAGSLEVARMLIATGKVDVNARDQHGQTPLMWATRGGYDDMVQLLLACPDIDVDVKDGHGVAAMEIASRFGRGEITAVLERWQRSTG